MIHEVTKGRHPSSLYSNQASVNHDEGGADMKPVRKEGLNLRSGKKDQDGKKKGGYAHGKPSWQQMKDLLLKVAIIKKNSRISQSQKVLQGHPKPALCFTNKQMKSGEGKWFAKRHPAN